MASTQQQQQQQQPHEHEKEGIVSSLEALVGYGGEVDTNPALTKHSTDSNTNAITPGHSQDRSWWSRFFPSEETIDRLFAYENMVRPQKSTALPALLLLTHRTLLPAPTGQLRRRPLLGRADLRGDAPLRTRE